MPQLVHKGNKIWNRCCREETEGADSVQAGLFSAVIMYCWDDSLHHISQNGILEKVRLGCQQVVVRQEDSVEELGRIAVQAASSAAPSPDSRSPAEAINLLRLLTVERKLLSTEAAAQFEVTNITPCVLSECKQTISHTLNRLKDEF